MRGETQMWLAPFTGPTLAAHGSPIQDDKVARCHTRDVGSDRLDDTGGFVAEKKGKLIVDSTLSVMQVGVAHTARQHF